jgi:hypothetical protein
MIGTATATEYARYQPATVDAPVIRPATRSCLVDLFVGKRFDTFRTRDISVGSYRPPAGCRGPWAAVVLRLETRAKGVQYDRIGWLRFGKNEVLRFSTAEPTRNGIDYAIEKDVTRYAPLLRSPQDVRVLLGNVVDSVDDGVFVLSASLRFYVATPRAPAPPSADTILPVADVRKDAGTRDGLVPFVSARFAHLPRNIVHATFDLFITNHGCDEAWYENQTDAFVRAHPHDDLCGGGAYRDIIVSIDGRPASVVVPFPYIWTGGANPILWRPLSALHTLDVPAYAVDLDPWAGVLADGRAHTIAVRVPGSRGDWPAAGNLLLWTDHAVARTGGAITVDTIAPRVAVRSWHVAANGRDRFGFAATRRWRVVGYVRTAHGRVTHEVDGTVRFANAQTLDLATGLANATQETRVVTTTVTRTATSVGRSSVVTTYPLIVNITQPPPAKSRPYGLVIFAHVDQGDHRHGTGIDCDARVVGTAVYKRRKPGTPSVAYGRTDERNLCHGRAQSFAIVRSAKDGRLVPPLPLK